MSTTQEGHLQPTKRTPAILSAAQLAWLKETQIEIDLAIGKNEPRVDNDLIDRLYKSQCKSDHGNWDWFIEFQAKVEAEARDWRIPEWAVPNVKAIWDAQRNRLGKGMSCLSVIILFSLILMDLIHCGSFPKGPLWFA